MKNPCQKIQDKTKKKYKKIIIYLDQNFISDIAKSNQNPNVNPKIKSIFGLLHQGFIDEKVVVPKSRIQKKETALATHYKEIIRKHQGFLGQVELENFNHIFSYQAYKAAEKFLGIRSRSIGWREAFKENPNKKTQQYDIIVDSGLWEDGSYRKEKLQTVKLLNDAKCISNNEKRTYREQKGLELEAQRELFLQKHTYAVEHLFNRSYEDLVNFTKSKEFESIPYIDITIAIWPILFIHCKNRAIKKGDYADIETIATYLPYVDVYATDTFMAELIKQQKLDDRYDTKVFSSSRDGLFAFEKYLKRSLMRKKPVNWPEISVFVLPDEKIKKNSWEFFRNLGNQCHGNERGRGWVEIYAFDDGKMPKYYDPRIKNYWPFYGLQDVTPIKTNRGRDIKKLCELSCRTGQYVLIDTYRKLPNNFINKLIEYLETGKTKILSYEITNNEK